MIRWLRRSELGKRFSRVRAVADNAAGTVVRWPAGIGTVLGLCLPFILLAIVTAASLVHWTTPLRQRLQWDAEERCCVAQLQECQRAFEAYRRDTGAYPRTPWLLYPKYVHDLSVFTCPAYRADRFSTPMAEQAKHGGTRFTYTYYFPYLILPMPEETKGLDRKQIPLMYCKLHAEVRYEAYQRRLVTTGRRGGYIQRFGLPNLLVLRQNGRVDRINDLTSSGPRGPSL